MTRTWILRRITHNFGWKLASVALAALLWFIVLGEPSLVTIQSVPLLYRNLPGSLILLSDAPDAVRAELRGPSGRLTRATLSDIFVAVDLSGVTGPGTQTFTLSQTDFSLPQGVAFLRAVPSQVSLRFDTILSKPVPVQIQFTGALPPGYRISAQTVDPVNLTISGPQIRVSGIKTAETDPVDLTNLTETTERKVNAFIQESRVQFESRPVVTVRLTIEKVGADR